jgi:SHS family sialic acid transporter-like MFS transporter
MILATGTAATMPPNIKAGGKWMALIAALLGWMFDGFEIGLFPLIGAPALQELLGDQPRYVADRWFSVVIAVFLLGAATGGVLFGWLGDRIGRVRAMSLSILTYSIFTGLCGLATEAWHIAVLRFIASLGMGGEWALGVALVTEIWPDSSRALLAGLIGAAANVGFLTVGLLSLGLTSVLEQVRSAMGAVGLPDPWVQSLLGNSAWRFLMIVGAVPALLVFLIRLFVPESQKWERERQRGATSHWATRDLLGVFVGALGAGLIVVLWSPLVSNTALRLLGTLVGIAIALVGFMYPVSQYLRRALEAGVVSPDEKRQTVRRMLLGAALAGVALLGTWGALQWAPRWAIELARGTPHVHAKEYTQVFSAIGAIIGTIIAALMGGWLGRRPTYAALCIASLGSAVYLYMFNHSYDTKFLVSVLVAGGLTAAFYGWMPLYLPELFRTGVRATCQGFAYNFGRVLAAIGTLQTPTLMGWFDNSFPAAGSALSCIYLIGALVIWLGPETKGKPLPP